MEKVLEVKNISKKYQNKEGEVIALKGINFRIITKNSVKPKNKRG